MPNKHILYSNKRWRLEDYEENIKNYKMDEFMIVMCDDNSLSAERCRRRLAHYDKLKDQLQNEYNEARSINQPINTLITENENGNCNFNFLFIWSWVETHPNKEHKAYCQAKYADVTSAKKKSQNCFGYVRLLCQHHVYL